MAITCLDDILVNEQLASGLLANLQHIGLMLCGDDTAVICRSLLEL